MRNASAADAAADRLRNERRDAEERLKSLAITHLVRAILQQNRPFELFSLSCEASPVSHRYTASDSAPNPAADRTGRCKWARSVGRAFENWLGLQKIQDLADSRLFRRRGGMLVARFVLAPDGEQILLQKIERIRGNFGTPLVDFFFCPMAVKAEGGVSNVLGKRETVGSFARQHVAELASRVQFVDAPS